MQSRGSKDMEGIFSGRMPIKWLYHRLPRTINVGGFVLPFSDGNDSLDEREDEVASRPASTRDGLESSQNKSRISNKRWQLGKDVPTSPNIGKWRC